MSTSAFPTDKKAEPPQNDSTDFVEHLRTVHFTLLATCLALMVIILSPSPLDIRKAITELDSVADSQSQWTNKEWVNQFVLLKGRSEVKIPVLDSLQLNIEGKKLQLQFDKSCIAEGFPLSNFTLFDNLSDFKSFWNAKYQFVCAEEVERMPIVYDELNFPAAAKKHVGRLETSISPSAKPYQMKLAKNEDLESYQTSETSIDKTRFSFVSEHSTTDIGTVIVPVLDVYTRTIDPRTDISNALHTNWHAFNFSTAFPELDEMTTGMQDFDFAKLRQILNAKEKSAKEAFEVFGVKFPIETTTRWGVVVIVSIQFYLWMHLAEYRKRQFSKSTTAWIALYSEVIPKVVFAITSSVLPVAVVLFLDFLTTKNTTGNWGSDALLALIGAVFSIIFALLCIREYKKVIIA